MKIIHGEADEWESDLTQVKIRSRINAKEEIKKAIITSMRED